MLTTVALEDNQPVIRDPIPGLYKSKDGDGLVLFISSKDGDDLCGIVVQASDAYHVGDFDTIWAGEHFEPFYGTISLKQTR